MNDDYTVQDLIDNLKHFPKKMRIIFSQDDEGNGYKFLNDIGGITRIHKDDYAKGWEFKSIYNDDDIDEESDIKEKDLIKVLCLN